MTAISEMTNEELRLAIAEIIAKEIGHGCFVSPTGELSGLVFRDNRLGLIKDVPDYPSDDVAALGLLDEFECVSMCKGLTDAFNKDSEKAWRVYIGIPLPNSNIIGKSFVGEHALLSRVISETWLKAKRGNDSSM